MLTSLSPTGRSLLCLTTLLGTLICLQGRAGAAETADPYRPPAVSVTHVPQVPADLWEKLRKYQNTRSAAFRGWAPDGRGILVQTRFGQTAQLHRVYEPGGRREQVTFFDEPTNGRFVPADREGYLLLTMSSGGSENDQIYVLNDEGEATLLTDGKSRNLLQAVRHDGLFFVVANNQRNGRDTDLYLADPNQPGPLQLILETDGEYWSAADWSRDGATLLLRHYVSINESSAALLEIGAGKKTPIQPPSEGKVSFGAMKFAADGNSVYVACDAVSEFKQLARVDLASGSFQWISSEIPWDVEEIEVEPQSGLVAFTINEEGSGGLYLFNPSAENGNALRRVKTRPGMIGSIEFSPDGRQVGYTLSPPDGPSEAWSFNISDGKTTQWTFSEVGGLQRRRFVSPELIRYPTFDERTIPAWYYRPERATAKQPVPVLINIHGGPESQSRPAFSPLDQFYLNELGIAVLKPNVRGSNGYGKTYLQLDNAEKREDSVRDIGALLDWIEQQPELDASRVAVYGASYGGYMVTASLTFYPERIKAGVDIVGLASFTTFLKNTQAYRRDLRRAEYGDERDPEMLKVFERINPTSNVHKIRSQLLVAHGKNDPRVPFVVAEEIVAKVQAQGQKVWTVYADNEGHGFAKKDNRDYLTAVIVLFLQAHLGK